MENTTQSNIQQIEFNSMGAVLKRLDLITYQINNSRQTRKYNEMLDAIIDYFKEISSDMKQSEADSLWKEMKSLKNIIFVSENKNQLFDKLDELDIKLRRKAKELGYLTRNQKDVTKTITDM
jgi:hypothetical protein